MNIEQIIDNYNKYIEKRRKETHTESNARLIIKKTILSKFHAFKEICYQIFYVHPDDEPKMIIELRNTCKVTEDNMYDVLNNVSLEFHLNFIDWFSENEDLVVEGKRWK